jgi:hypothetical protein
MQKKSFKPNPVTFALFHVVLVFFLSAYKVDNGDTPIDLSGKWAFQIDSLNKGVAQHWFSKKLNDVIQLPGSMLTNGKGYEVQADSAWTGDIWNNDYFKNQAYAKYRVPGNVKITFWLQPLKRFVGVAWYQKEVNVPANWNGRAIELFLERCHWETTLWIDDTKIGMRNALSAPDIYDLGNKLKPGKHRITLRIDNRVKDINPGHDAHSISDNTQTNWNGIIGKMQLLSRSPVYISDVQLFPDIDKKVVTANITIKNLTGREGNYKLQLSADAGKGRSEKNVAAFTKAVRINADTTHISIVYPMGTKPLLWDEFHPDFYTMNVKLTGTAAADLKTVSFGMRTIVTAGKHITVNGRTIFLRGTLECAIFPKTGFPPTNEEAWARIFRICKSYGLNHIRFHSWCPPEAAFDAADKAGMYLSIENSAWARVGDGMPIDRFIYDESNRIVSMFGNHPSFCMMPYGNEASGKNAVKYLTTFVNYWKAKDKRRIYTSASGFPVSPASDYTSSPSPRIQWWEGGLTSVINAKPPSTNFEWTPFLEKDKPTVSHEIGQWCVYPNFKEMAKYDGVLKPKNFEIFKDKLQEHGMLNLADSFLYASGKLQVLCYKADIEAALRTPDFAGFQLLDLHDFPGQGTALVGVLDPFWEEKGYVTAKEYKRFCNSTVPLARMPKLIFSNRESLNANLEVAHFGEMDIKATTPEWKLTHADGSVFYAGKLKPTNITAGKLTVLDSISKPLDRIVKAEKLTLTLRVDTFENSWNIWVYPVQHPIIPDAQNVKVVQRIDKATEDYINNGGTVLLTLIKGTLKPEDGGDIAVGFSSIFWNTSWTKRQAPHTLGILCNPNHPALSAFPTESYSDYQWWDAMSHSNAICLDSVDKKIQPIVRIIDDWYTARPLGLIFECKVGKGKILVSGIDLLSKNATRPEARQLLYSLEKYMTGDAFKPTLEVSLDKIKSLIK